MIDFLYMAFVFFISMNAFVFLGLHSAFWLMAYAYAMLRIAALFPAYVTVLSRNWVFLLYPALCLLSVLWSDVPTQTLRFSLQLMFSVMIAVLIGMRFTLDQIFIALTAVLFITVLSSLANFGGAFTPAYDHRNNFKGIFLSKNVLGHRTVLFTVTCVFGVFLISGLRLGLRLALLAALGVNVFLISISGSATAVGLSGILAVGGILIWVMLGWRGGWTVVFALATLPLALALFLSLGFSISPLSGLLELLGRDTTLTGRTVLWDFAIRHLDENPLLGFGANGFWTHPAFQNQIIALQSQYGEGVGGFHNLILELLIMLGPLGLIAHTLAMSTTLYRSMQRTRRRGDVLAAWALTLTLGMYMMAMFGAQLFQQHAIPWILVVVFGVSLSFRNPPRRHRSPRPQGFSAA
ncbi:O-antigen ligase family protein [Jannaschia faecimaris]|uniref:O-antigen ligase family protein n=1 Tax=Jannaschia faecimaris TaxID=1244108 RepID=UPI000B8A08E4|nr:O-antigen ligase family protein [Jannaschia faecimaris]